MTILHGSDTAQLDRGREAYERHAWDEALAHLSAADETQALAADDVLRLAYASYWTGSLDDYLALLERAYGVFLRAGDRQLAALAALNLHWDYMSKPAKSLATGWYRRAERMLESCPECAAHGYLAQARIWAALARDDLDDALHRAREMVALGEKLGDRDLQVLGLQRQGQVLLAGGDAPSGLELLDEAVVAAISGELGTMTTAAVYCAAITCCRDLADYERASQWSGAVERWCEREACTGFPGLCRIYRAELIGLSGAWAQAEVEFDRACEELRRFGALAMAAGGFYELGELRRRRGDLGGAQAAYARAYEYGLAPQPGFALVRLAQGDIGAAAAAITRALTGPDANTEGAGDARTRSAGRLGRVRLLPAQVEIALAAGDLPTASAAVEELESIAAAYDTKALHAHACDARAATSLAEGDLDTALTAVTRGRALWQELEMPYEAARTHMTAAAVHHAAGDLRAAELDLRTAHATFERLGADPDLRAAATQLAKNTRSGGPNLGLSPRELEVLRLVADGLTDVAISRRLFLSPHTVHRHVANIRTKTNQPSRAAVVAQATRLGVI